MSNPIGWCTETWNPISGCSKVSPGCLNCYANRMATRLAGRCGYPADDPFRVTFHPDRLYQPLKWKKPRRVFVVSMGDLFHEDLGDVYRDFVFDVMTRALWHTYLILTKRPESARRYITDWLWRTVPELAGCVALTLPGHVWLGVTVEDQRRAAERIPLLLATPAAYRFVSCEPLLGPVDIAQYLEPLVTTNPMSAYPQLPVVFPGLDWIIAGAETGPGARPADPEWFLSLRDQCQAAGVSFYLKGKPGTIDGVQYREIPEGMPR